MPMSDKVKFIPFHAINEFMTEQYQLEVLLAVFVNLDKVPADYRRTIQDYVRKEVRVPGFRNANQAPPAMQAKSSIRVFERRPEFVAAVLAGWAEMQPEFCNSVYEFLLERGWKLLPLDANRTKLPGFLTRWSNAEGFETLTAAYREQYPEWQGADNDISLMVVWLSGRLPVELVDTSTEPLETELED